MRQHSKYLTIFVLLLILGFVVGTNASIDEDFINSDFAFNPPDTTEPEDELIFPLNQDPQNPYATPDTNALFLKEPANVETVVEYDPVTNEYVVKKKIGDFYYRDPVYMSLEEYREYDFDKSIKDYWRERSKTAGTEGREGIIPQIHIGGAAFDKIFGSSTIDIRPQGSAELIFGVRSNFREDPLLNVRQQRTTNFDFKEKIQMNVIAKIGDKIEFKTNYNTESQFDFENKLKLKYEGDEDDIIKLIEAGDVTLPLTTSLITGTQSLFGIKTKMQFGRTMVTGVFSQQESEKQTITVEGGAQTNEFFLTALDYEENRHFFLAQYFREHYEEALSELPIVASDINITKIEVWVTNIGPAVEQNRNIVAFTDLGEYDPYSDRIQQIQNRRLPSNRTNNLTQRIDTNKIRNINLINNYLEGDPFGVGTSGYMVAGEDFEKVESAKKLTANEYTLNPKLGFISLNTNLNPDQTLAVAFQYQRIGDSTVYQVGEFSDQGVESPKTLMVKLLKSTTLNTSNPIWDLMMKNVYNLGAYQVNNQDFLLNIFYSGSENGVPTAYLSEGPSDIKGVPLLRLMNFDNLNQQHNPHPDGFFDFIDGAARNGGTIQSSNGRVYFTMLQPFGNHIHQLFGNDTVLARKYAYDSLYSMTKAGAEQFPDKNKFTIEGFYKSSVSNEISLNAFNIPRGSVTVTAGGRVLAENVDYTVDYTLGRVRIINEGILNSGTPINISLENNALFSIQTKRLMGLNVEHMLSDNFVIGGTLLNLTERPITQKTNYGDDPISNTIWGLNFNYREESRWLTNMVDKIPLIETKAPSHIEMEGEFAHFLPGHSRAIGKTGSSYIDDFEGALSTIDLRNVGRWFLASTPQGQPDLFPEALPNTAYNYGKNRAKLAWYIIDPIFYDRTGNMRPSNVEDENLASDAVRMVRKEELFPEQDIAQGTNTNVPVFNLAYYPSERGPYNYDAQEVPGLTAGLDESGNLAEPETRWGGIMREIETTDFEEANVEYIEFWLLDPWGEDSTNTGTLYFNLGDISEDILRDGRKSFENGYPTGPEITDVDTTIWGRVPTIQALVESFDDNPASRQYQDIGYDGLSDEAEQSFFQNNPFDYDYLAILQQMVISGQISQQAFERILADPSGDNYHYFRGTDYNTDNTYSSILERYKDYNNPEGNSPSNEQNPEDYPTAATQIPNIEDINRDNTLNESERYFQYKLELDPEKMKVGQNYVTDVVTRTYRDVYNEQNSSTWYQIKIPVRNPDKVVGSINDFTSIRFIRMFLADFEEPIVCRFGTFELVRGEWRRYTQPLFAPGLYQTHQTDTRFNISRVNIEANNARWPINYVLPPEVQREVNIGTTSLVQQNEQSLVLKTEELTDGEAKAIFKTTDFDFRQYQRLKMYVHAEKMFANDDLDYGELSVFIRIGSDLTQNYYEYELPLTFTDWDNNTPAEGIGFSEGEDELIWPEANNVDIDLERLVQIKHNRNIQMRESGSNVSLNTPFVEYMGEARVTVLGSPTISDVKSIMIGVRNPRQQMLSGEDDGQPKSAEIWINELRLTDFNKQGGWAATARVSATLADFGRVTLSGTHTSAGFGSLDQQLTEVSLDEITEWGVSTDLELGKFLPEESGVRIPMHFDYSETHVVPEYNPLDPDIKLQDDLDSFETDEQRDSLKTITREYVQRKSINFINVRKDRVGNQKPQLYDIENFTFTYAYSEIYARNIDVEYDLEKTYNGGIGYAFNGSPKNVKPFDDIGFLKKSDYLKLIRDFNFFYLPKTIGFRTDMTRQMHTKRLRNKSRGLVEMETFVMKDWDWQRNYNVKFDLTQSLSLDFQAGAMAYIDEPQGLPDKGTDEYQAHKDSIVDEILNFGSIDRYNHTISLNYKVPIDKLPIFSWITLNARYQGTYNWMASPKSIRPRVGNQVENSNSKQLNGDLAFDKLYAKVPYFKKINEKGKKDSRRQTSQRVRRPAPQEPEEEEETADTTKPKPQYFKIIGENILRIMMGLKKTSFSYNETNGTFLPGFIPEPTALGMNFKYRPDTSYFRNTNLFTRNLPTSVAPGVAFVAGIQDAEFLQNAFDYGWISPDSLINQAFATKYSDNLNVRASIEPIPDLRIDITADRSSSLITQSYLRLDSTDTFRKYSQTETGSFSMSYVAIGTAFKKDGLDNYSELFQNFKEYRAEIAMRLAIDNPNYEGKFIYDTTEMGVVRYPKGYGPTSQPVMHYAFMAAYTGKGVADQELNRFPKIPLPNWRISYDGLSRIPFLKRFFKKITLSHSYQASYSVSGFTQYTEYAERNGFPSTYFANGRNFIPKYDIAAINISEQFSPLLGIDITMNNNVSSRLEYKKARNLTFSFANNQLTEIKSDEFVIGVGYKIKDVSFSFVGANGRGNKRVKSDLDLRADFSIRNNKTVLRRVDEDINQVSAGQKQFTINTSADYMINSRFTIRLFFDKVINNPYVSNQYRTSTTNGGVSVRFALNQ